MKSEHARRVYFEQIKRVVPLEAILQHYGILSELKREGSQLKGRCPIHKGSNPRQFVVDLNKNVWRCFSPKHDSGGAQLEFVAEFEQLDILHAAQLIAGWFAIGTSTQSSNHRNQQRSTTMSGGKPSHKAFVVEDKEEGSEEKPFWTRVGSAWPHGDGKGLNIQIASGVSVAGRLVLREYTDKDAEEDEKKVTKFKKK